MPGFWDDSARANKIIQELKSLKSVVEPWLECQKELNGLKDLADICDEDFKALNELDNYVSLLKERVEKLEFSSILSGEHDRNNAILSIHAGAGGTESCDWVAMLLRMYLRWAESRSYSLEMIDTLPGEEAGIKNVTTIVRGAHAYGYLKAESGVHRLVRISPFDSNKRRHTSFASVDVIPEIEEEIKIDINEKDLRIDVFRSSGPGGQSVNTTDSAVRITHIPTGVVVQCQNERSQLKNKNTAMKVLKARLYEKEQKEREERLAKEHGEKKEIAWGSQIRSYVFHPYSMVKDHRTGVETGNVQAVMDGKIDDFIEAYLKSKRRG